MPTAAAITGALADEHRRLVFAAVQLGAVGLDAVVGVTRLTPAQVGKALGKLVEVGLISGPAGALTIDGAAFQQAAREALSLPVLDEHADAPQVVRKVLNAFVADGRLHAIPTVRAKRLVVLDWLAQSFEPGRRYSEQAVNLMLGQRHADTAALRRYLVDEGFLDRSAGEYWRVGGSVDVFTDSG